MLKTCKSLIQGNRRIVGILVPKSFRCSKAKVLENQDEGDKLTWEKWWNGSLSSHPGVCNLNAINIPSAFDKSAALFLEDCEKQMLQMSRIRFSDILWARVLPDKPPATLPRKPLLVKHKDSSLSEMLDSNVPTKKINWRPIIYDKFIAAVYLVSQTPSSYAACLRVLSEIKKYDDSFDPSNVLDVGSGNGVAVWACNKLWPNIGDYYCIEPSRDMTELSNFLLSGGVHGSDQTDFMGVHIREDFKAYFQPSYSMVMCLYTLSEIGQKQDRLNMIKTMWEKTEKYLIIVELGNSSGFKVIKEARELLLRKQGEHNIQIAAPCPHLMRCPMSDMKKNCAFTQKYFLPSYAKPFYNKSANVSYSKFSYIVFKKSDKSDFKNWPRAVSQPSIERECVTCHFCTPSGSIEHIPIHKDKVGIELKNLGKKTQLGDLFPMVEDNSALEEK